MFLVTHAAVGAIVGQATGSPALAALGGFVSHFLIDMIPHGDTHMLEHYKTGRKKKLAISYVVADIAATALFILALFSFRDFIHPVNVSLGIIFGIMPDAVIGLYETKKFPWLKNFYRLHFFFHNFYIRRRRDFAFSIGFALQLLILAFLQMRVF